MDSRVPRPSFAWAGILLRSTLPHSYGISAPCPATPPSQFFDRETKVPPRAKLGRGTLEIRRNSEGAARCHLEESGPRKAGGSVHIRVRRQLCPEGIDPAVEPALPCPRE